MNESFMRLAKRASLHSTHPKHQLGAVLVHGNRVISVGFNKFKTSPRSPHPYNYLHAEIDTLLGLDYSVTKGATMYIYREANGLPALSKPCESCQIALDNAGVRRVYYTTETGIKEWSP